MTIRLLVLLIICARRSHVHFYYCEGEVHSSSVSVVYVVRLCIIFSKASLQKRGSMEPMEPPLDPPLLQSLHHTTGVNYQYPSIYYLRFQPPFHP